jgi:tRNA threonylcarbamoyladenosine biosynthesis protein TsaB
LPAERGATAAPPPAGDAGSLTLALDASTYSGSVAVVRGSVLLAERSVAMRGEREERLMPAVAAVLGECGVVVGDLARVVCGAGPGSFTSLRIAASIAKGIAQGAGLPLYAVSSLSLLVAGARPVLPAGRYLAALDAMRGERYVALVGVVAGGAVEELSPPAIVAAGELDALALRERATLVGPEWTLPGHDAPLVPRASGLVALAGAPDVVRPVDLATWEPSYGRLAEAQVQWVAAHGRSLPSAGP